MTEHDKYDGCYRIGHPGALLALPDDLGVMEVKSANSMVFSSSATGATRALLPARREPRQWKVEGAHARPELYAPLLELLSSPSSWPPYVWVTPWSAVTNLLTPEESTLDSVTLPRVGRMPLAEGGWAAVGAINPYPVQQVKIGAAPVVQERPATATVRVASTSTVQLFVDQLDAAGATITTTTASLPAPGSETLHPISITLPAPHRAAVAVGLRVLGAAVLARAQVTWTTTPTPFSIGDGCSSVVVHSPSQNALHAVPGPGGLRRAAVSFEVIEVG